MTSGWVQAACPDRRCQETTQECPAPWAGRLREGARRPERSGQRLLVDRERLCAGTGREDGPAGRLRGLHHRSCRRGRGRVSARSRETVFCKDPGSGGILDRWHDPLNGRDVDVVPVWSDSADQGSRLRARTGRSARRPPAQPRERPLQGRGAVAASRPRRRPGRLSRRAQGATDVGDEVRWHRWCDHLSSVAAALGSAHECVHHAAARRAGD